MKMIAHSNNVQQSFTMGPRDSMLTNQLQ